MPLIVMCGIPSSGKTKRATELCDYLRDKLNKQALLINEESIKFDKLEYYSGLASCLQISCIADP